MGRLGRFVVRRRRAVILVVGRAADRDRHHRQLRLLGAVDRLRRRHHHRVGPSRPAARRPGRDRRPDRHRRRRHRRRRPRRSNATITAGLARIAALDGVLDVADPWSTGADALRATDGRAALVVVTLAGDLDEDAELALAQQVEDLAHELDAPEVLVGGNVLVSETFATASEKRPPAGRGDRPAHRHRRHGRPARRARRRRHAAARRPRRRPHDPRRARRRHRRSATCRSSRSTSSTCSASVSASTTAC